MSNGDSAERPAGGSHDGNFIAPFLAVTLVMLLLSCAVALQRLYH
jgi:hypothetical protein